MNSPLPFLIASPPFLRRYIESSPRSTRYILFSSIITSFYFFPITIHRFSRPVSVSPTHLRSTTPLLLYCRFHPLFLTPCFLPLFHIPFLSLSSFFFFFNYYPLSSFSPSPSFSLARNLLFSPLLCFSVMLCIFLLFSFITRPFPPRWPLLCRWFPSLSLSLPAQLHSVCRRIVLYVYMCGRKRERGRAPCRQ